MPPGPQQPNSFPWSGKIIPWSAALRSGPTPGARTLADLPHGETVKVVLRSGGWLYVESHLESRKPLKGYVSRELLKHVQPTNTAKGGVQQNVKADVTPQHIGSQVQQKQTTPRAPPSVSSSPSRGSSPSPPTAITAWWQLQHQHGYAPLITRIAFEREFRVSVPPARGAHR
ncbi:SH3 domain-containing protein [Cystobacter fuscus]|uniref:SH3 domain-containing protein n=1 Tax=Cystobacter fuscus TaxID=43 RepID=UPI002B28B605|nr:SH3 domain-containing protein [Cystobacter fuscus]